MKWIDLVPSEFRRLAQEEGVCLVPMGSLERHGEHLPLGCDLSIAETVAEQAAEKEPCVVFPGYFLAQVHEASCFTGTVNLPKAMAIEVLSKVLDGIAKNGFKKIVILNCHGGNDHFLRYFCMSQMDEERDYVLYVIDCFNSLNDEECKEFNSLWETEPLGHACELETSLYMACKPGLARIDLVRDEPVLPLKRFDHLHESRIHNAYWWYADFPQNVVGVPGAATQEKGEKALRILVDAVARALNVIKHDTAAPALQKEFHQKVKNKTE